MAQDVDKLAMTHEYTDTNHESRTKEVNYGRT